MADAGIFDDGEAVELLEGDLVLMSPIGPRHVSTSTKFASQLERAFPRRVRSAGPVVISKTSLPEPDVAVVRDALPEFDERHPRGEELILAIEVSRTSLARDRQKAALYASGGVPEYWIVDVEGRQIEVHTALVGDVYTAVHRFGEADFVNVPECGQRWLVADFLPRGRPTR